MTTHLSILDEIIRGRRDEMLPPLTSPALLLEIVLQPTESSQTLSFG